MPSTMIHDNPFEPLLNLAPTFVRHLAVASFGPRAGSLLLFRERMKIWESTHIFEYVPPLSFSSPRIRCASLLPCSLFRSCVSRRLTLLPSPFQQPLLVPSHGRELAQVSQSLQSLRRLHRYPGPVRDARGHTHHQAAHLHRFQAAGLAAKGREWDRERRGGHARCAMPTTSVGNGGRNKRND